VCFVLGQPLVIATGGNEFVFKIPGASGPGRPASCASSPSRCVARCSPWRYALAARRNPQLAEQIDRPGTHRMANVTTAAVGVILVVHAVVLILLALTTLTSTSWRSPAPSAC
jgi:hypothetical protein